MSDDLERLIIELEECRRDAERENRATLMELADIAIANARAEIWRREMKRNVFRTGDR